MFWLSWLWLEWHLGPFQSWARELPDSPASVAFAVAAHGGRVHSPSPAVGQQLTLGPTPHPQHGAGMQPAAPGDGPSTSAILMASRTRWPSRETSYKRSLQWFLWFCLKNQTKAVNEKWLFLTLRLIKNVLCSAQSLAPHSPWAGWEHRGMMPLSSATSSSCQQLWQPKGQAFSAKRFWLHITSSDTFFQFVSSLLIISNLLYTLKLLCHFGVVDKACNSENSISGLNEGDSKDPVRQRWLLFLRDVSYVISLDVTVWHPQRRLFI